MTPVFGKGIAYDAEPHIMKEQLGFFHAALRDSRLRSYAEGFVTEAEHSFGKWGREGVVNMLDVGNEVTLYTSTRCLLGEKMRHNLSKEFSQLYHDLEGGINVVSFFAPYLPLPSMRRRDRARVKMVELITQIVAGAAQRPAGARGHPADADRGALRRRPRADGGRDHGPDPDDHVRRPPHQRRDLLVDRGAARPAPAHRPPADRGAAQILGDRDRR
jgi:hypothetical protein